jgi:hypothetical protein
LDFIIIERSKISKNLESENNLETVFYENPEISNPNKERLLKEREQLLSYGCAPTDEVIIEIDKQLSQFSKSLLTQNDFFD